MKVAAAPDDNYQNDPGNYAGCEQSGQLIQDPHKHHDNRPSSSSLFESVPFPRINTLNKNSNNNNKNMNNPATGETSEPTLDNNTPTTSVKLQLVDGSRIVKTLNMTHIYLRRHVQLFACAQTTKRGNSSRMTAANLRFGDNFPTRCIFGSTEQHHLIIKGLVFIIYLLSASKN